ncbi:MAG: universal stress protein [Methanococci archaeon]|nr:universal stress protein [Methanococci archaeon]
MYKKIVVPTDGSDVSLEAAKHAIAIAKEFDSELYAIYVVDVSPFVGLPAEGSWELISELLKEEGKEALKKVKKLAEEEGLTIHTEMLEGVPATEIVEFAEKKKADLIVMGTTGKTGLERILLGSVAERVIKNAHCPVLVVKKPKKEE